MHLGRFHHVVNIVDAEIEYQDIEVKLGGTIAALQNIATDPSNAAFLSAFHVSLESLRQACYATLAEYTYASFGTYLDELGARPYVGAVLFDRIKATIDENQLHATQAVSALQAVLADISKFYKKIHTLNTLFTELEIEYEALDAGENELGITIPVDRESKTLLDLSKLTKEWNLALDPFVEIFDPEHDPFRIRVISSSDWQFYLVSSSTVLLAVSVIFKQINGILREVITSKKLLTQLVSNGAGKDAVDALQADIDGRIDLKLKEIAEQTVDNNPLADDGRNNELKIALTRSCKFLATQISNDVKIEIRLIPVEKPEQKTESDGTVTPYSDEQKLLIDAHNKESKISGLIAQNMEAAGLDFEGGSVLSLDYELE